MNVRRPWFAEQFAARSSHGEPRAVVAALEEIGSCLERGALPDERLLPWPEEPLRSVVVSVMRERALPAATCARATAVVVALQDVVEVLELAWETERRMRAGQAAARAMGAAVQPAPDEDLVRALWEPLAVRGTRAELGARWGSAAALYAREAQQWRSSMSRAGVSLLGASPSSTHDATIGSTVSVLGPQMLESRDGAALFERLSQDAAARGTQSESGARASTSTADDSVRGARRARARKRSRQIVAAHAALRGASPSPTARFGTVFIAIDRDPREGDSELVALRAALLLVTCAAMLRGRVVCVVTASEGEDAKFFAVESSMATLSVLARVSDGESSLPIRAMTAVLRSQTLVALSSADLVVVTTREAKNFRDDPVPADLEARLDAARAVGLRTHLVRPGGVGAIPHSALFDLLHFPEFSTRTLSHVTGESSLPPR